MSQRVAGTLVTLLLVSGCTGSATDPDGWIDVGTVARIEAEGVVFLAPHGVFVVSAPEGLVALLDDAKHIDDERVLYCAASGGFQSPFHGEQFDLLGRYRAGPAHSDMDRVNLRVVGDVVQVSPGSVTRFAPGERSEDATPSTGPYCDGDEARPGFFASP